MTKTETMGEMYERIADSVSVPDLTRLVVRHDPSKSNPLITPDGDIAKIVKAYQPMCRFTLGGVTWSDLKQAIVEEVRSLHKAYADANAFYLDNLGLEFELRVGPQGSLDYTGSRTSTAPEHVDMERSAKDLFCEGFSYLLQFYFVKK